MEASSMAASVSNWETLISIQLTSSWTYFHLIKMVSLLYGCLLVSFHPAITCHTGAAWMTGLTSSDDETRQYSLESSPFGQLLAMLSTSVVWRRSLMTDRLLRLLSLISLSLPDTSVVASLHQNQQLQQQQQQQRNYSEGVRMRDLERRELHSSLAAQMQ